MILKGIESEEQEEKVSVIRCWDQIGDGPSLSIHHDLKESTQITNTNTDTHTPQHPSNQGPCRSKLI